MPSGAIITTLGLAKLASATPLNQLNISSLAVGDGNGGYSTLDPSMTALTNEVWRGTPSPPIRDPNSPNVLIFEAVIPPSVGGFTVREQAIFDDAGDMIAIGQTSVVEKPLPNTSTGVMLTVRLHVQLNSASQVDLFFQDDPTISAVNVSNANGGSVQDFIDSTTFNSITEMKGFQRHLIGSKVRWLGYYSLSDGGSNWGVVKSGAHVEDGGSIFSIDANTYVEANLKGKTVNVNKFGATKGGDQDNLAEINNAISYLANESNSDTNGSQSFGSRIGDSRALQFSAKRYGVSATVTLINNISVFFRKAALVALAGFAAATPVLTTAGSPYYSAPVKELIIDGNDLDVKGVVTGPVLACEWHDITVLNCRNDGITASGGADFVLNGFFVSCSETPSRNDVAGLKTDGSSDATFTNGICRFNPVGIYARNGGNNEFANIHCWGGYADRKQYINVYIKNSYRNSFVNIYADSPTKQDYTKSNTESVGGFPNGGVCYYFEREGTITSGAQANTFTNCRYFANNNAYANAGLTGKHLLIAYFDAFCFYNTMTNTVRVDGEGETPFLDDKYSYWNNDIKRSTTIMDGEQFRLPNLTLGNGTSGIYSNSGSPEGVQIASEGSLYLRTDAWIGTEIYHKKSGNNTNVGWLGLGNRTLEGYALATIGTPFQIARITPTPNGITRVEVDLTAIENAGFTGVSSKKFIFLIKTTGSTVTTLTTPVVIPDYTIDMSNANYDIDIDIAAVDIGGGAVRLDITVTETGGLSPTQAEVVWCINAQSSRSSLRAVSLT